VVFVEIFRGTSELVQLFWVFFALPILTGNQLTPIAAACIVFGLNQGSYISEIVRSAMLAVPRAQREAVVALNMPGLKAFQRVILPQAIPSELRSSRFIVEVIVAHEFGHAVQARTGILSAAHGLSDAATTTTDSNQWSRRTELQADCFAGLFIRSVSKSAGISQQDLDNIATLMVAFGDDSLSKNLRRGRRPRSGNDPQVLDSARARVDCGERVQHVHRRGGRGSLTAR